MGIVHWIPTPIRKLQVVQLANRWVRRAGARLLPAPPPRRYDFRKAQDYWGNVPRAEGADPIRTAEAVHWSDAALLGAFNHELEQARTKPERRAGFALAHAALDGLKAPRVLDYGSGLGFYGFEVLSRHPSAHVTFADINADNLAVVARLARLRGVAARADAAHVQDERARDLRFDQPIDLILSMGVLHHTPHAGAIVEHLTTLLRPGGRFLVMLYNDRYLRAQEEAAGHRLSTSGFGARTDPTVAHRSNPYSEAYDDPKATALFPGCEFELSERPDPYYTFYRFRRRAGSFRGTPRP